MKINSHILIILIFTINFLFVFSKNSGEVLAAKPVKINDSMLIDGVNRTFTIQLPSQYKNSEELPLIIALHGGGGSAARFEVSTGLSKQADIENFISKLIDTLVFSYKINPHQIYLIGHSNGGMMAYRLACELSTKIAAIAVSSCTMVYEPISYPSHPISILHIHASNDNRVPLKGGVGRTGVYYPPIGPILQEWANHQCNFKAQTTSFSTYTLTKWKSCNQNATIELYIIQNGDHAWPIQTNTFNANQVIMEFFKRLKMTN